MKKIFAALFIVSLFLFTACRGPQHKADEAKQDTSKSTQTNSAASDTIDGSMAPFAESTNGSDTSSDGSGVDAPLADTAKAKKHHQ